MTTETHPDEPLIKIEVDGVTVTGEFVFIQYNDITVRIHGHYDLKSGLHIPYFALGHSRYTTADGKPNETGTHRGRSILKELYDLAAFIRSHFDELRSRWASHEAELKDLRQGIVDVSAEIRQVKREMRQHVKAGGKQRDFQLRITALRNANAISSSKSRTSRINSSRSRSPTSSVSISKSR